MNILGDRQCDGLSDETYIPSPFGQRTEFKLLRTPRIVHSYSDLSQLPNDVLDELSQEDRIDHWVDSIQSDRKTSGSPKRGAKNPNAHSPIEIRNEEKIQGLKMMKKQDPLDPQGAEYHQKSNNPDDPQDVDNDEEPSKDAKPDPLGRRK